MSFFRRRLLAENSGAGGKGYVVPFASLFGQVKAAAPRRPLDNAAHRRCTAALCAVEVSVDVRVRLRERGLLRPILSCHIRVHLLTE